MIRNLTGVAISIVPPECRSETKPVEAQKVDAVVDRFTSMPRRYRRKVAANAKVALRRYKQA